MMKKLALILFASLLATIWGDDQRGLLLPLLRKVAGVYQTRPRTGNPAHYKDLTKTVIVTAINHGYINHIYNFDCFMKRLKLKYLVIAMDQKAYVHLKNYTSIKTFYFPNQKEVNTTSQIFRTPLFNIISMRKMEVVLTIMRLGYHVLFSDADVAVVRDPIPYLYWKNVDYVHSASNTCDGNPHWDFVDGNTGFYFVRSNQRTMKLWRNTISTAPQYVEHLDFILSLPFSHIINSFPESDDQTIFWKLLWKSEDPRVLHIHKCRDLRLSSLNHTISLNSITSQNISFSSNFTKRQLIACMLDDCIFSAGMVSDDPRASYDLLIAALQKMNETMCTVHGNYMIGNTKKMNQMKEFGYWIADLRKDYSYRCLPFQPKMKNTTDV